MNEQTESNPPQNELPERSSRQFWLSLVAGFSFIVIAGLAAFLTGYLLGVREADELVALAIISVSASAIGGAVLIVVAFIFRKKGRAGLASETAQVSSKKRGTD